MNTRTLPAYRPRGIGWILRIVMAVAIVTTASWFVLPEILDGGSNDSGFSRVLVTTDEVNLRSGPGMDHDVIRVVPTGTEVASDFSITNGYTHVEIAGQRGWMSAEYLAAPGRDIAQVQSVQAAELPAAVNEQIVETTAEPVVVEQVALPKPTDVPTYAPVIAETTQVQAEPQPGEKWIEVNRSTRTVTLHNGEIIVAQFDALMGKDSSTDGYYSTAIGTYHVHVKEKSLAETPFADGVYLTDFVGFDSNRSNGFHSPVRDEQGRVVVTGGTTTLGCVRLAESDAIFLFEFATIGMRVEVHD